MAYHTAIVILIQSSANLTAQTPTFGSGLGSFEYFLIFFAVIITLRLYRGFTGRAYSTARVVRLPVIYALLTVVSVGIIGITNSLAFLSLVFLPIGLLIGYKAGVKVKFFMNNNVLYYRRSPVMMAVWLVSFIGRYALELFYPTNFDIILLVDSILSLTTGLLAGEAINIVGKRKEYNPVATAQEESDAFKIN